MAHSALGYLNGFAGGLIMGKRGIMDYRKSMLRALLALALSAGPVAVQAQNADLADDWCRQDAPGLWRGLRESARTQGSKEVAACPKGGAASEMPQRLIVPLPCNRQLDLVRVDVPTTAFLDHLVMVIGGAPEQADVLTRHIQGVRDAPIAGAFSLSETGPSIGYRELSRRVYWIGSHEWTALQQALVQSGAFQAAASGGDTSVACNLVEEMAQGLSDRNIFPATDLSWYDAQDALRALNAYVFAEGQRRIGAGLEPIIPWEQGSSGFFRLPSETEWEFAARGGVAGQSVRGPLHHVIDAMTGEVRQPELSEVAQIGRTRSGEAVAGVGGRMPNALGLYDTIGNASEMVHDLFSLVRPDRNHGAKGGGVLRGGNSLTPESVIGIAHRQEVPPFDASGEGRSPVGGMRVVLTSPVITRGFDSSGKHASDLPNPELEEAITASLEQLVAVKDTAGASYRTEARALLAEMQSGLSLESPTEVAREQINQVSRALEQSEAAINEAREAEIRARVRSAVDGILLIRNISAISLVWLKDLEEAKKQVRQITMIGALGWKRGWTRHSRMSTVGLPLSGSRSPNCKPHCAFWRKRIRPWLPRHVETSVPTYALRASISTTNGRGRFTMRRLNKCAQPRARTTQQTSQRG